VNTFDPVQRRWSWLLLSVMAGMLVWPPWAFVGGGGIRDAGYAWLWQPPVPLRGCSTVMLWSKLELQWLVVAVGLVLMLFLRECRVRHGSRASWRHCVEVF
jgi:hypothetical protein